MNYHYTLDKTFVYEYNNLGNIVSVKEYDYTTEALSEDYTEKTYTYSTSQRDRLNNFNGTAITYNAMGCPTSFNGFDATWTRGKLSGLSRQGTQISYEYNAFGQRIRKNISYAMGGVTGYEFCYDTSGRLICERKYSENGTAIDKLVYLYDENTIIGVDYTANGATNTYFFQRNLLGDVIGIYDSNRVQIGKYKYDAWGNCTTTLDTTGIAYRNPIRYRSYYYDTESGLYYLNARYYNPEWRRFISPDSTKYLDPESVNGLNLYAYCNNDPVNYADPSGHSILAIGLILLATTVIGGIAGGVSAYSQGYRGWDIVKNTMLGAGIGLAVGGAIIAVGAVAVGAAATMSGAASAMFIGVPILQAFAIGSLAFDAFAYIIAPLFGALDIEGIEYEPVTPYFPSSHNPKHPALK